MDTFGKSLRSSFQCAYKNILLLRSYSFTENLKEIINSLSPYSRFSLYRNHRTGMKIRGETYGTVLSMYTRDPAKAPGL